MNCILCKVMPRIPKLRTVTNSGVKVPPIPLIVIPGGRGWVGRASSTAIARGMKLKKAPLSSQIRLSLPLKLTRTLARGPSITTGNFAITLILHLPASPAWAGCDTMPSNAGKHAAHRDKRDFMVVKLHGKLGRSSINCRQDWRGTNPLHLGCRIYPRGHVRKTFADIHDPLANTRCTLQPDA